MNLLRLLPATALLTALGCSQPAATPQTSGPQPAATPVAAGTSAASATPATATAAKPIIKLAMFSDEACSKPLLQDGTPFVVEMDVSDPCYHFVYVDPEGEKVDTTHADFKCYEGRISYDKYPFSADCTDSARIAHIEDYEVGTTCQFAPSHGGGVYEQLVDYVYPGSEDCTAAP